MLRPSITSDPARDAGSLLRRLGFATLVLALPVAALFIRRGTVIVLPIGVALTVGAALLDGLFRPLRESAGRLLTSPAFTITAFALSWAGLSIAWSPDPAPSAGRLSGIAGTLALGLAGYFALPDRMRAANLYLLPVGVGLGAAAAVATILVSPGLAEPEEDGRSFERGMAILTLFVWPAIAWLRSRDRDGEAIGLVLVVTLATLLAPQPAVVLAFAAGGLAFVATSIAPRAAVGVASLLATLILLAPLPALLPAGQFSGAATGLLPGRTVLEEGRALFAGDPVRLLTGHGFGAFLSARFTARALDTPLVQLWYDLGIVGALAAAAAIWTGLRRALTSYAPLLPSVVGAFACAFALACAGTSSMQAWQPVALCTLILMFVSVQRGQFRTRRPPANLSPVRA